MTRARDVSRLVNANQFTVDAANNRIGLGSETPDAKLDVAGIVSATSYIGVGSELTGVSAAGIGSEMDSTQGTLGNLIYKTPRFFHQTGVTSAYVDSGTTSGKMAYTRLAEIIVGGAATMHIGAGVTMIMNVLNIF